jgi:DNA polymerase-3 subunit alpha
MHNLFRLSSLASLEGFYYKPRIRPRAARPTARAHRHDRLPVRRGETAGCRPASTTKARAAAAEYRDIFGAGNFYVELMDHGLGIERRVRADLLKIARDLGLPLLATNDLHYTYPKDAEAHEVLLCVQTGKTMADPNRFKFDAATSTSRAGRDARAVGASCPRPATTPC